MRLKELVTILDKKTEAPRAASWDNSGLLLGDEDQEVRRILVALEITQAVVEEAATLCAELVVSHHPVIFAPLKSILRTKGRENPVYHLLREGIGAYACHTNFDAVQGGLNDYVVSLLQGEAVAPLEEEEGGLPFGRLFTLPRSASLWELCQQLEEQLGIEDLRLVGDPQKRVQRLALVTGSGGDMADRAFAMGAQALITGDLKYHEAQDMLQKGYSVLDAGHYGTEKFFPQAFCRLLQGELQGVELLQSQVDGNPFQGWKRARR